MNLIGLSRHELELMVNDLLVDKVFGVYTRQAIPYIWKEEGEFIKWIVFFDLNNIHEANTEFGYGEVDTRIKRALSVRTGDTFIARWYSGDELVVFGQSGSYKGFIDRIVKQLGDVGLSAMYSGTDRIGNDYKETVESLIDDVTMQKEHRDLNLI